MHKKINACLGVCVTVFHLFVIVYIRIHISNEKKLKYIKIQTTKTTFFYDTRHHSIIN